MIFVVFVSTILVLVWCAEHLANGLEYTSFGTPVQHGSLSAAELSIQWLTGDIDPLAVCNDGSPGAYYFTPATVEEMKNVFVVFLPGGGQCFDETSCAQRWQDIGTTYMSSTGFLPTIEKAGILDTDPTKSPFYGANKAVLGYCSSDGYMGDTAASADSWGWHFRGQRLVRSMLQHLQLYHGLNGGSQVLLGGASAGARGMMALSDLLHHGGYLPIGSQVALFLDSPYYIDIVPYSEDFAGFPYQEQQKYAHENTSAVVSSSTKCNAAYSRNDAWKCQFGQYRLPFLQTIPYLLIASQYDAYQLGLNTGTNPPYKDAALTEYAEMFANETSQDLKTLATQSQTTTSGLPRTDASSKVNAYFSWACYNHAVSESIAFSTVTTEIGVSQFDALTAWLTTSPFVSVASSDTTDQSRIVIHSDDNLVWMDSCTGFACGAGCAAK